MYEYGVIGNCQIAAHVHKGGSIDWLCMPRPDAPPIFGRLLDPEGGHFEISAENLKTTTQHYLSNTNVLVTEQTDTHGARFRILDFCPRFYQYGRIFRPAWLFRIVEPLEGTPKVRIQCRPVTGWDREYAHSSRGNSHLRYTIRGEHIRLTTSMPLTYLCEETTFLLQEPLFFSLQYAAGLEDDIRTVSYDFLNQTVDYWRTWVKHCSIPYCFQKEVLRSALTLKLHVYEDTGAILAALTTSLPERVGEPRNWDYRFCWLRDAYFVLSAFHRLGHFEEMEGFLKFLLDIAHRDADLHPCYTLDQKLPLPETIHPRWQGFMNTQPVRSNNQAAEHIQNDVYGEMMLALSPIYFDERFNHLRDDKHSALIRRLAQQCAASVSVKDAGPWELRDRWQEHSFTNLMCWAGLDRYQRMQNMGQISPSAFDPKPAIEKAIESLTRSIRDGVLTNGPTDPTLDASLLVLPLLNFPDTDMCKKTVHAIYDSLSFDTAEGRSPFLYRYRRNDDFGVPTSAFLICSFWLIQSLAKIGEVDEAHRLLKIVRTSGNHLDLYSEHFDPSQHLQIGNFPQTYSHVGLISSAFAISPKWEDVI